MFFWKKRKNYYNEISKCNHFEMHSHILPAVDDGAPTMEMALHMLKDERKQGVYHVILTPHLRKNENDFKRIQKHFRAFQAQIRRAELNVEIYLGSEIYYDSDTLRKLKAGEAFTMAGTRYVLIEFSPVVSWGMMTKAMDELIMNGYFPILAHAERYECIMEEIDRIELLVEKGAFIQINANSFLKHPRRKELINLLKAGLIHFVGTDCHRTDWRPVCMKETCEYLANRIDKEDYSRVFFENPQKLLNNEVI